MSVEFYEKNHREYIEATLQVDMSALYQPFCQMLHKNAKILDAGCGSGRDTQFFINAGFEVVAIDASSKMVKATKKLTGADCRQMSFEELKLENDFDGIWACASLLHVKRAGLPSVLTKFASVLRPNGVMYISFKHGTEEREAGLRYFNDLNQDLFNVIVANVPNFEINKVWITCDARPRRGHEKWLNCILIKEAN